MTTETSIYEYAKQSLTASADKVAIWFYGKSLTYRKLFSCIDNVADHMYAIGVRKGSVVTIHLPNCPQAAMAVYAVAKLGGICNMVHPQVPFSALQENMEFAESTILITGDHFNQSHLMKDFDGVVVYARLSDYMGPTYKLGYTLKNKNFMPEGAVDFKALTKRSTQKALIPPPSSLVDSCVAYLHSSGTTGMPKTVMHSHGAFNRWVEDSKWFFHNEGLDEQSVLAVAPFFHGSGLVIDLHRVLSCGGVQSLVAQWRPKQAVKMIKKHKISILTGVPAIYKSLLACDSFSGKGIKNISQCFVSGDRVPRGIKEQFNQRVGDTVLFEAYGMTEIVTACFANSKEHDRQDSSGYPLINCYAAILDGSGTPRKFGEGEILVSTNTMMLGYLKDEESTRSLYVDFDGKQWIRTGDMGAVDKDGFVYFKDRIKHIIVRNGFNVFPYEIEAIIRKIHGIKDVCVLGVADERLGTERIVAFVEIDGAYENIEANVIQYCEERLPKFSVPNEIRVIPELPRNRMRKIDRSRLKILYD